MLRTVLLLIVAVLVQDSFQRGALYLNEIQAYPDPVTSIEQLPIECTLWEDNFVFLDAFDGIPAPGTGGGGDQFNHQGSGVEVDGALLHVGTWVFPNDFNVAGTVTINGLLEANGGLNAGVNFSIEDETGNTFVGGDVNVLGQVNNVRTSSNPDGTFVVDANSGETTVSGLLKPNGGIDVANGEITISNSGSTFATGSLIVRGDLILGDTTSETRRLIPFASSGQPGSAVPSSGGRTTFQGQDAADIGGNIVLIPGVGKGVSPSQRTGDVILGLLDTAHDLSINRPAASSGNAGDFVFSGQESSGKGGDLVLKAGNGNVGGNLILSAGQSSTGEHGSFYLGDPEDNANAPFYITRPTVSNSNTAGSTFFSAQNSTGTGGMLAFYAGNGATAGGDIHLEPGMSGNNQGWIFFGSDSDGPTNLALRHTPAADDSFDAAGTWFMGQTSRGGNGGDVFLEAGSGSAGNGDLYLSPGAGSAGSGFIYWGPSDPTDEVRIVRPPSHDSPAHDTVFHGGLSTASQGGAFSIEGGSGFVGGDIHFHAGDGEEDIGGQVFVYGGAGTSNGDVSITSGASTSGNSGNIHITAGAGAEGGSAGSLFISAVNGEVQIEGSELYLSAIPLFVDQNSTPGQFTISSGGVNTILSPIAGSGFIQMPATGVAMLQPRISLSSTFRPTINPYEDIVGAAEQLRVALNELRAGLIAQGLFQN